MVLVTVILITAVLMALGITAILQTSTDIRISGNKRVNEMAFYAAEAGVEEARGRMRAGAANRIQDSMPSDTGWRAYIGASGKAQALGYDSTDTKHLLTASLQSALDYTVIIAKDTDGGVIVTTNDGQTVYLVRSSGNARNAAKVIEARVAGAAPVDAPSALYVKAVTTIQGTSTNIIGEDRCGTSDKPGVVTILDADTVRKTGQPEVCGVNDPCGSGAWDVVGNGVNIDVQALVDRFKDGADYSYNVEGATHTGMAWGTPTLGANLQDPSSCDTANIVYYNTNDTDIKLAGGTQGCGILLVDGDLEVNGGFSWYGLVIVSGAVTYLGGGDKNITGAVMAGSSLDADLVGGNSNIVYCSEAISNQTASQPWRRLSWKDEY